MNKWLARSSARPRSVGLVVTLLILVSGFASAQPRDVTTSVVQVAKLTASDGDAQDVFGWSVSIGDDVVVVGAYWDDDSGYDSGSAYLFEKPDTGWTNMTETAKFTASDGAQEDFLGISVSISGDTVVVGAYGDDDSSSQPSSAYLFAKPEAGWDDMTETAKLAASDGAEDDYWGWSVSLSGDTLVVGSPYHDDGGSGSGAAYLFEKPETGWADMTETAKLTASDGAEWNLLGSSVSISGDTMVVGAPLDDDNGSLSGSAYVFFRLEPVAWVYLPVVLRSAP